MRLGSRRPTVRHWPGRAIAMASTSAVVVAVITTGALGVQAAPAQAARQQPASAAPAMRHACQWPPAKGNESCFALYQPQTSVNRAIAEGMTGLVARPKGLTPKQIESAYRLPINRRSHQTVAVSIAYNTPHLAQYLAVYRNYFGLPPCTVQSGCFRVVNQNGGTKLPPSGVGSGWDLEVTLDVSMISVACPHCHILVVEAQDPALGPLGTTDTTAARLGAQVISNSYGQPENGLAMTYAHDYRLKHHTVVVAAGDDGFTTANFPANLGSVTAVGGTELTRSSGPRGWRESVWNNSNIGAGGSGCSAYIPRPSWQHKTACPGRTINDVAAVAANVPIYNKAWGGWITVDGTSISAPLTAGIYGLAGNGDAVTTRDLYLHVKSLFHIGIGNNAWPGLSPKIRCGDDYLCVATPGYNAPTGLGTPDGIGAF